MLFHVHRNRQNHTWKRRSDSILWIFSMPSWSFQLIPLVELLHSRPENLHLSVQQWRTTVMDILWSYRSHHLIAISFVHVFHFFRLVHKHNFSITTRNCVNCINFIKLDIHFFIFFFVLRIIIRSLDNNLNNFIICFQHIEEFINWHEVHILNEQNVLKNLYGWMRLR